MGTTGLELASKVQRHYYVPRLVFPFCSFLFPVPESELGENPFSDPHPRSILNF